MSKLWVHRESHNLSVDGLKVLHTVTEGSYLRGADKRAVINQQIVTISVNNNNPSV